MADFAQPSAEQTIEDLQRQLHDARELSDSMVRILIGQFTYVSESSYYSNTALTGTFAEQRIARLQREIKERTEAKVPLVRNL